MWAKDIYRKNLSKCCCQKGKGPGKKKKGRQSLRKKEEKNIRLQAVLRVIFQIPSFYVLLSPQIFINYGSCVPWKFINVISFGKAFPASFPYTTIYLVSWFSFLSVGSMVQLKDNRPKCLKRNSNK